ncbi:hypothetical protein JCM8547_007706 [Rhodosporidiobolus lusitaniae]
MRLPLEPTSACTLQLASSFSSSSPSDPPLVFIDNEPFLVELQGILGLPPGEQEQALLENGGRDEMEGVRVGKVDLSNPKKPVLRIAHHRLEGKLETLLTPYALLRTTRIPSSPSSSSDLPLDSASSISAKHRIADVDPSAPSADDEPFAKRAKLDPTLPTSSSSDPSSSNTSRIEIVSLIRRKLVFSRRPEPLIDVSSEADHAFAQEAAKKNKPHPMARLGGGKFEGGQAGGAGAKGGGAGGVKGKI